MADLLFVSVVLATFNRRGVLGECLDSLMAQTYPKGLYEVVVVDDGSTDDTLEFLKAYSMENPSVRFFTQENQGPYVATNLGIDNAKGEVICITGDDCIAEENWIQELVNGYITEDVGGVGGEIASYTPHTLAEQYCDVTNIFNQDDLNKIFLMTGNASYRKKILYDIGGFDDFFRNGGDVDCGIRVKLESYNIIYRPEAVVYHKHGQTFKSLIRQKFFHGRGYARLHKKYPKNFNPYRQVSWISYKVLLGLLELPIVLLKSFFMKKTQFYIMKRLLDIVLAVSYALGMITETLTGGCYCGEKITKRLEFIERADTPGGWGI